MLNEGWRLAKGSHFFQNASYLATPVVIADENIFWPDGSETRFVPSLYIANLFQNVVVELTRFTKTVSDKLGLKVLILLNRSSDPTGISRRL
jgi:hypothetical protein